MSQIDFTKYGSSKPIREITYEALKDAIISGSILPGERIVESRFAKQMNISRTPIREALRKLETDGLVEYTPRRGVVVKSLSIDDINEIYDIRHALESLVVTKAAELATKQDVDRLLTRLGEVEKGYESGDVEHAAKISREMHKEILMISGMTKAVDILISLDEYMQRFSYMSLSTKERRDQAASEHRAIVRAIGEHNIEELVAQVEQHINSAKEYCVEAYIERMDDVRETQSKS